MTTTNRKRSTSAKSTAKPAPNSDSQAPEQEAPAETGESAATPAATVESAAGPTNTPDSGPIEVVTGNSVTGDGSGEALPPVDPEAGERTAEGVSDDAQGDDATDAAQDEIPALFIRTRKSILKRRRCGHVFTPEGHGIALSGLSTEQIAAFESDPTLVVEECSFPAQPDTDTQ
ncbi:hypothetical protein AAGT95_09455 [Salinicola lusitanus]|uniref:Mu-like prophage FluMu N-terminal domain-containing protein n=1 Tax=Salinicola lusitanus TaxID=1949085 RepID=A0ABZ3CYG9_9GAMM